MKRFILTAFLFTCLAMPAIAQKFYTETGKAVFTSKVPLHTFSGTSENLTGMIDLDKNTVDFYIDLATL
ncbi:MAG TPA: YceI family protein, partial [Balneolaceae bacterium]|nr:YceI family protein [Balneolaceae bacterium]